VQPLLNHHLVPTGEIVQAGGHGAVEPLYRRAPLGIGFGLVHTVRIVHHHDIGPFPGGRSAYGSRDTIARMIILEAMLLVLIAGQLVALAPALLVPIGFNQPPAFEAVAHAQVGRVAGKQPAGLRVVDPDPGWPKNRREQGFSVTGRNVNDQIPNPPFGNRLQMLADGLHMQALNERRGGLQNVPSLGDELN